MGGLARLDVKGAEEGPERAVEVGEEDELGERRPVGPAERARPAVGGEDHVEDHAVVGRIAVVAVGDPFGARPMDLDVPGPQHAADLDPGVGHVRAGVPVEPPRREHADGLPLRRPQAAAVVEPADPGVLDRCLRDAQGNVGAAPERLLDLRLPNAGRSVRGGVARVRHGLDDRSVSPKRT